MYYIYSDTVLCDHALWCYQIFMKYGLLSQHVDIAVLTLSLHPKDSSQSFLNITGTITLFDCTSHVK